MPDPTSRVSSDEVRDSRHHFANHGYAGPLSVVDEAADEVIFVVAAEWANLANDTSLSGALQSVLGRKVWVVAETDVWRSQARLLE